MFRDLKMKDKISHISQMWFPQNYKKITTTTFTKTPSCQKRERKKKKTLSNTPSNHLFSSIADLTLNWPCLDFWVDFNGPPGPGLHHLVYSVCVAQFFFFSPMWLDNLSPCSQGGRAVGQSLRFAFQGLSSTTELSGSMRAAMYVPLRISSCLSESGIWS